MNTVNARYSTRGEIFYRKSTIKSIRNRIIRKINEIILHGFDSLFNKAGEEMYPCSYPSFPKGK